MAVSDHVDRVAYPERVVQELQRFLAAGLQRSAEA
jgi:hypothetical protein